MFLHKQDVFIILLFFVGVSIVLYIMIIKYDDPDATIMDLSRDSQQNVILELKNKMAKAKLENRSNDIFGLIHPHIKKEWHMNYYRNSSHKSFNRTNQKLAHVTSKTNSELFILAQKRFNKTKHENNFNMIQNSVHGKVSKVNAPAVGKLSGGKAECTLFKYQVNDNETFECVPLVVESKPYVCLYPNDVDTIISGTIRRDGIWEPHLIKRFIDMLHSDSELGFIDIGANIGVYTLVAASLQRLVIAIEPYEENLKHLSHGLFVSHLENQVTVLQNAVYDKRIEHVNLQLHDSNQGATHINNSNHGYKCYGDDCPAQVKSILMDDLLEVVNFKSAIIKIDIEGHEHRAFKESTQLFQHLYVPYIIMEWQKLREYYGSEVDASEDKTLVHNLVQYLTSIGYDAFASAGDTKLNAHQWYSWPDDIIWKHEHVQIV